MMEDWKNLILPYVLTVDSFADPAALRALANPSSTIESCPKSAGKSNGAADTGSFTKALQPVHFPEKLENTKM